MMGLLKNKELDGVWKEKAVAKLNALHQYVSRGDWGATWNNSRWLSPGCSKHETGVLAIDYGDQKIADWLPNARTLWYQNPGTQQH